MALARKLQAEERASLTRECELPSLGRPLSDREISAGLAELEAVESLRDRRDSSTPAPLTAEHRRALALGKTTRFVATVDLVVAVSHMRESPARPTPPPSPLP